MSGRWGSLAIRALMALFARLLILTRSWWLFVNSGAWGLAMTKPSRLEHASATVQDWLRSIICRHAFKAQSWVQKVCIESCE